MRISEAQDTTITLTHDPIFGGLINLVLKNPRVVIGIKVVPQQFQWIWNSSCQPKHKIFFYILLHDTVNTRNLLRRKTFYVETYNCALMPCQHEETVFHLFWGCPFAERCWKFVCPSRDNPTSVLEAVDDMRVKLTAPFLWTSLFWLHGQSGSQETICSFNKCNHHFKIGDTSSSRSWIGSDIGSIRSMPLGSMPG